MKILNKINRKIILTALVFPAISNAQPMAIGYLQNFYTLIQRLPRFIFGLSVVFFFWGTGQFILNAGDEKYRADGKKKIVWGIIALTVYASIYGILNLMSRLIRFTP
jgi:Type IV secretion system pilin